MSDLVRKVGVRFGCPETGGRYGGTVGVVGADHPVRETGTREWVYEQVGPTTGVVRWWGRGRRGLCVYVTKSRQRVVDPTVMSHNWGGVSVSGPVSLRRGDSYLEPGTSTP